MRALISTSSSAGHCIASMPASVGTIAPMLQFTDAPISDHWSPVEP
jgi:hypothetical protein